MAHTSQSAAAKPEGNAEAPDFRRIALLAVTLAVLAVILLPCVVQISPTIHFELDPRSDAGRQPITSLGPAGAAWLNVIGVFLAAAALGVHRWLGGRIRWGACALAAVGIAACAWQMPHHFDNRLFGAAWTAAVAMALAVAHLGEHEAARRWLVAGLVAILVVFVLDAGWYVLVEHPETVAHFERNERELIESRGWRMGSAAHQSYEQRLRATDALGAFGLSNVLGSIAAALTVLGAAVTVSLLRDRPRGWALAAGAATVSGAVTVWLTNSRGALVALLLGLMLIALTWAVRRWRPMRWVVPTAAVLLVLAAVGAVLVRGAMGPPETAEGERSMLFRYHYWQGAVRMMHEHLPESVLRGFGPAGFQAHYLWAKNPISPESVSSAHNVFVDYITMLGVGGIAWSLLLLLWLWQAGRTAVEARDSEHGAEPQATEASPISRGAFALAGAPAVVIFGMQYWLELPMMWLGSALLWLAGALLFVGVTGVLAVRMRRSEPWLMLGLFGAAAVLLVHNQIEMGFFQLAPTGLVWAIVGLAAAGRAREAQGPSHAGRLPGAAMCIVAVWLIVAAAGPFTRQQHHLAEAAAALQRNQYHAALEALDAAGEAIPRHSETLKQRVHLRLEAATALAQHGRSDEAREMLREASAVVEHAERLGMPGPRVPRLRAAIEQTAARALGQTQRRAQAAAALREAIRRTPYDLRYRLDLGDLYWHMDQRDAAAAQYRSALRTSEQSYLDPTKQLTTEQRAHVEARLGDGR